MDNQSDSRMNESISSFQLTQYEDSDYMINAYKRKKVQYDKYKKKCIHYETELYHSNLKVKNYEQENKTLKDKFRKVDSKVKELIQIVAKNEVEGVKKSLEIRTKQRDMYKAEYEKLKSDNGVLRQKEREMVTEIQMF